MAFTIEAPKSRLLLPLFILLVVILAPFALLFSLIRIPFAQRRLEKIDKIIQDDWIVREKYIYINYFEGSTLSSYIERELMPKYSSHIIVDKWNEDTSEWSSSEPDTYNRVTAVMLDKLSDFDAEYRQAFVIIRPEHRKLTDKESSIIAFYDSREGFVSDGLRDIEIEEARKVISEQIESVLKEWRKSSP